MGILKLLMRAATREISRANNTPEKIGTRGEKRVNRAITEGLDEKQYKTVTDVTLRLADGTTQIDQIIVSRFGIFIVETKNMSGWIFGGAAQKFWTQTHGGKKRRFQNPIHQNYKHVKAVEDLLKVNPAHLHNLVVFVGSAEPKTHFPKNVAWGLRELGQQIGRQGKVVLSDEQVRCFVQKLNNSALERSKAINEEHINHLDRKVVEKAERANKATLPTDTSVRCPRCDSKMVSRSNKTSGDSFWGCSQFPKCRGTRQLQ